MRTFAAQLGIHCSERIYWNLERRVDGKSEYLNEPHLRDLPFNLCTCPRWIILALIRSYQIVLSPVLAANTCRFYPSCSHYGYQAIYKFGAVKGTLMAAWRVLRCNPFNPGGFDPVP
jgi:putative membrane protein insertion efficiency factor